MTERPASLYAHPTAIIEDGAIIGDDVRVEAFSIIERGAIIGDGARIGSHSRVFSGTTLGRRCVVRHSAAIGGTPQALAFDASISTTLEIGDDSEFYEGCTIHRGTTESYTTRIGARCRFQAFAHVAHDSQIGNDVVLENFAGVAGHVHVGNHTVIRYGNAVHQFTHIGSYCDIGSWLTKDIPPYLRYKDPEKRYLSLNESTLRLHGWTDDDLREVRTVYRILYESGLNVSQAVSEIESRLPDNAHAMHILSFIKTIKRGLAVGKLA
jgi:UDP-N-acetylglucosamine acyltransferase